MFDAIGNLPLHPLVIHAVVIGVPLGLLLALLFALPRTRSWARWPLAVTAVGSVVATFVARESGEALRPVVVLPDTPMVPLIATHARLATQLLAIMAGFAVLAVLNAVLVSAPAEGRAGTRSRSRTAVVLPLLLVVVGVVATIWVVRVGDVGSRAVWNPAGTVDYSVTAGR